MGSELPVGVERFLAEHVRSVNELELLLLLFAEPGRSFTADDAAARLYQASGWVAGNLEALAALGLVEQRTDGHRYAPCSAALDQAVSATAHAFRTRRTRVIAAIYRRPRSAAEDFADAFRIRDEAPEDDD